MVIKYTNIFQYKTLKNLPKLGFFGLKKYYLATLVYSINECIGLDEVGWISATALRSASEASLGIQNVGRLPWVGPMS
jgi:hypothetical protein